MSKYELTISTDYVRDWGFLQALREFVQNAIDESRQNSDNTYFFHYDKKTQTFTIGNKHSVLNIDSLLLGVTTKSDDKHTIGQFGEGYKIATMVLLRTGHTVTFYNYGAKEVWTTKLVKSRRYGGQRVPTFYVDKNYPWQSTPDNDLTIKIGNVTEEEYESLVDYILLFQKDLGKTLDCDDIGTILLEERFKGKVFVSGLYVCTNDRLNYGYNIKPEYLALDRDRQTVADFDLVWTTSRMWGKQITDAAFRKLFFSESNYDIHYLDSMVSYSSLSESVLEEFYAKYGTNAIPVSSQEEFDVIKSLGGHPVFVSRPVATCLRPLYTTFTSTTEEHTSCYDMLKSWYNELYDQVTIPESLNSRFLWILDTYESDLK